LISPNKIVHSQKGSTIVVAAIGLIALGAIFYSYVNWATSTQKGKKDIDTKATVRAIMDQISNSIDNDQAFFNTASNNPSLNCFVNGGSCPMGPIGPINVYLAGPLGPNSIFASSNLSTGFDLGGKPCTSFDSVNGNDQCPIRFEVTGEMACSANGVCTATVNSTQKVSIDPQLRINIKLKFKPRTAANFGSLNEEQVYNINFDRGQNKGVTQNYCAAIGGIYNTSSKFCILNTQGDCPAGTYMTGIDGNGGRVCQSKQIPLGNIDAACGSGSGFVGMYVDGRLTCGKY